MAVSLLAYVATLLGQLYFWRSDFYTPLQSNYLDTTVTFLEQLFLQSSCFFEELLFQDSHFFVASIFQNSCFFRAILLPTSHFLRIGSSLGELLFGTATYRRATFFEVGTAAQDQLLQRSYFLENANYSKN